MEQIITDVIIGVIILSMLLVVIPIYRSQSEQMASVIEMTDQNEKIGEVIFSDLPKQNDIVSGRYIKELIYFYVIHQNKFSVTIKKSGALYIITENVYDIINSIINDSFIFFTVEEINSENNTFVFAYYDTTEGSA